tara:strand:- start:108 stop:1127 length:1020 start_codon:yes stop_codon:yes gene_type:complete
MKGFGFDVTNWTVRQTVFFLAVFVSLYGVTTYGIGEFGKLYENPFELLPAQAQWLHESPIQYLIGYILFNSLPPYIAYILVQIIGGVFLIWSYLLLLKNREIMHSELFLILAMSPFLLVIFTWHGKPDIFLIASCFGMLATSQKNKSLFPIFFLCSVFSHPQITIFYVVFFLILNQVKFSLVLLLSAVLSYGLYFGYINELGDFSNRYDYIFENFRRLLLTQAKQPFFSIFCTFGWLWIPILYLRSSLSFRFFTVAVLCFGITLATLDHTRVFVLLSIPLLVYLAEKNSVRKFCIELSPYLPIVILLLFQFQKRPGGEIVDTSWSWFWGGPLAAYFGLS